MLRFSKKIEYGFIVIAGLTEKSEELCSAKDLSERYDLSRPLVANTLKILNKADILESVRGVQGGYKLCVDPVDIPLSRIITLLDGEFALTDCQTKQSPEEQCSIFCNCPIKGPIEAVQKYLEDFFNALTCADILPEHLRKEKTIKLKPLLETQPLAENKN